MNDTRTIWGGITGKIIALFLVLAVIFGCIAASLAYAGYGKSLLSKEDINVLSSENNKDGTLSVRFRIDKPGSYLSAYKTYKEEDKLMVKLYSSTREGDFKVDSTGVYTLNFKVDKDTGSVVQEGPKGEEYILVKVNIKP